MRFAFRNGLVRTFRLAYVAVYASVGDRQRHVAVRRCGWLPSGAALLTQSLVEDLLDYGMDKLTDVATQGRYLAHQR